MKKKKNDVERIFIHNFKSYHKVTYSRLRSRERDRQTQQWDGQKTQTRIHVKMAKGFLTKFQTQPNSGKAAPAICSVGMSG